MRLASRRWLPLLASGLCICACDLRAAASEEQQRDYKALRRDFFVVMPIAAYRDGAVRKEISGYLGRLNAFLKDTEKTAPEFLAAAYYFRGRVQMKLRRQTRARSDFDAALERLRGGGDVAPGTPSAADVQVYRAFTFTAEGHERIMSELEAIPAGAGKASYHEVGTLVSEWAEALADADLDSLAMRALLFIQKHDLWDEEADDPQPKILRLRYKMGQGDAPPAATR